MFSSRSKRRLALLAVSTAISLLLAEFIVRVVHGAPLAERLPLLEIRANEFRGWEMVPDDHYTYLAPVQMNSLGLRGRELEPKTDRTVRILCLGDSLTYGQGVADDESIPACLEAALRRADPSRVWEAVNAGHRSYATLQEVALLEELGPRIEPDIVLVLWYWNDLVEPDVAAMTARLTASGPVTFDAGDRLVGAGDWRWHGLQLLRRSALLMALHDASKSRHMGEMPSPERLDRALVDQARHLDRILTLGRERGFVVIYGIIPDANALGVEDHWTKRIRSRITELVRSRGVVVVDLEPPVQSLAERSGRQPVLPYDGHYDASANRAMGEFLAGPLRALANRDAGPTLRDSEPR